MEFSPSRLSTADSPWRLDTVDSSSTPTAPRLRIGDYVLLTAFCLTVFGFSWWVGRPLSRHEAVLPQTSREMLADHDFLIPKSDGRPWLESPPLPQWITVGVASLFGRCDREWIVRIAPALVATFVVLITAGLAASWQGRIIGLLSGFVLATLQGFTSYAWRAEDEMFLCGLVTLAIAAFARAELGPRAPGENTAFLGRRPWPVLAFFVAWGATNLAKGVLFGAVLVAAVAGGYLLSECFGPKRTGWRQRFAPLRRYVWLPGWFAFLAVAIAWPLAAAMRYPDVVDVWLFDQVGRMSGEYTAINRSAWYYALKLPETLLPWTPLALLGLGLTRRAAWESRNTGLRLIWCWAILPPLVLSIPQGKHHHYLIHGLAPWAILAACGLLWVRSRLLTWPARVRSPVNGLWTLGIPGVAALCFLATRMEMGMGVLPLLIVTWLVISVLVAWGLAQPRPYLAGATLFGFLASGYLAAHVYAAQIGDRYVADTQFVRRVRATVPAERLFINAEMGQMETFHCQFYLAPGTRVLHNLSFLRSSDVPRDELYLITYASDADKLSTYGQADVVLEGEPTYRDGRQGDTLVVYRLHPRQDLLRVAARPRVSPLQAMRYAKGPYLGKR